jgi:hypothetical protein
MKSYTLVHVVKFPFSSNQNLRKFHYVSQSQSRQRRLYCTWRLARNMPELVRTSLLTLLPDALSATIDRCTFFFPCSSPSTTKVRCILSKSHFFTATYVQINHSLTAYQADEVVALGVGEEPLVQEDPGLPRDGLDARRVERRRRLDGVVRLAQEDHRHDGGGGEEQREDEQHDAGPPIHGDRHRRRQ